jgi:4-amino-4-deoxy-L-arabinose transferase-like glycosyltransferase
MKTTVSLKPLRAQLSEPIVWVLIGALALRVYSAGMRCVVNPDAAQYLFQASAIFNQQWHDLFACKLNYSSSLPFVIAASFWIFRDWIIAGQAVSILFGTATLIPLFFLLRRFWDRKASTLAVLIYALMPVFVEGSGDILRDPLFWFFSVLGMLMFIRQFDESAQTRRYRFDLVLSCLFFLLAAWARIEGLMYLVASPFYLLIASVHRKIERILLFIAPLACLAALVVVTALATGSDLMTATRLQQVHDEATRLAASYTILESQIKEAYSKNTDILRFFLHRVREILILIPIASILHNIIEGVFYPFALIYFIGFAGLRRKYREDRRIGYFLLLSLAGFLLLYLHMIQTWMMFYRFLAILIYPGCVIMANGVETIIGKLEQARKWPGARAAAVTAALLILFGLPKSLKPEEMDKVVYRQAAQLIDEDSAASQTIRLYAAASERGFEWVLLYAHRAGPVLHCSEAQIIDIPAGYEKFIALLDSADATHFLYEKRFWPESAFDIMASPYQKDLSLLGKWKHPDSSELALFKRLPPK